MNNLYEQEIRYRLLKILSKDSSLTQREMSRRMGISLGKLNYCLTELARKGFVKVHRFKDSAKKPRYIYLLTPRGAEEKARVTLSFLRRKIKEYEEIKTQIKELSGEIEGREGEHIGPEEVLEAVDVIT
ncbi:MAG: MarR family EPS-associated transcriptional regulator [Deltaproteobacteria bacterium]|nr:MarR family EPS-associated transcriptional regulator [Deltaproteobacteria bacterium]MBW2046889.1 MarR family EPS-associated transcriptional regulator [Deltaproteobacteria bacterium]MBW2300779.1 MarR family EPS-associated transcriptional regulator [Deltaproteobacteria bacterium]